jgi:hypothetical protein
MSGLVSAVFGGNDAPPPPDYAAAAKETAAGNLDAARLATRANRINQVTPYGSLSYQEGPNDSWTQTMNLTPQAQATLDKQMRLSDQYADTASKGFANVQGLLENPNIDTSNIPQMRGIDMSQVGDVRNLDINGLPQAPINAGQTAQEALFSRLNPTLSRDEEALRTRLANQGIQLGSSAYNREMDLSGQRANDLRLQAAAQGLSLDQAARNAAFGERQAMSNFDLARTNQQFGQQQNLASMSGQQRNQALQEAFARQSRPLDLVNALRTGAQVQNPQFNNFAQQQTTTGPNMNQAAQLGYEGQMGLFNAGEARDERTQNMMMQAAGMFMSDRRTKENIQKIGVLDNGLNLYKFDYKPEFKELAGHGSYIGVMADEAKVIPDAVIRQPNGYDMVDYSKIYA